MALSVVILVGEAKNWVGDIAERAKKLVVAAGKDDKDFRTCDFKAAKRVLNVYPGGRGWRRTSPTMVKWYQVEGFENNFVVTDDYLEITSPPIWRAIRKKSLDHCFHVCR